MIVRPTENIYLAYWRGLDGPQSGSNRPHAEFNSLMQEKHTDRVTVSPQARALNSMANKADGDKGGRLDLGGLTKLGDISSLKLGDIRDVLGEEFSGFRSAFGKFLRERGIDRTPPFTLTSDREGNVTVQGEHPRQEEIEAIFAEHPELRDKFSKISAMSSLLRAARAPIFGILVFIYGSIK